MFESVTSCGASLKPWMWSALPRIFRTHCLSRWCNIKNSAVVDQTNVAAASHNRKPFAEN